MPAGEVRAADVSNLASPHQIVERAELFLDGRLCVEAVQLIEVDVVGTEPAEASFDRTGEVLPRRPHIVWSRPGPESALGRDQDAIATAFDRLAEDRFSLTARVDVRRVEHRETCVETDV